MGLINLQELYEWRWVDESNGLVFPYYTKPCLEWLKTIDFNGKRVWEYGCGSSTVWYAAKGAKCYGVESNLDWHKAVMDAVPDAEIYLCEQAIDYPFFLDNVTGNAYDIIIVDGIERDECLEQAIEWLKPDGILVVDNYDQPSVWTPNDETRELLSAMEMTLFPQSGHPDWQTAIFRFK